MTTSPQAKQTDVIETSKKTVRCDGKGKDSGHPVVYIAFGKATRVVCEYCSQVFALKEDAS